MTTLIKGTATRTPARPSPGSLALPPVTDFEVTSGPLPTFCRSRLRSARELRKLTQGELAGLVGLNIRNVQRFEDGSRLPSVGTLCQLAAVLGVSPGEFFALPDTP